MQCSSSEVPRPWLGKALHRDGITDGVLGELRHIGDHVGVDNARSDRVDTHAPVGEGISDGLGHGDQGSLAGGVRQAGRAAIDTGDGSGIDDAALGLDQVRDRVLHHGVGALHVQVADGVPLGLLELGQPGAVVGAGVVDEHIQTAPLGNDLFVQFLNGLVVAQVDGLGHDFVVGVDLLERC